MARILWAHSESSEEIEQCISSHHLSRIDWCAFLYLCPWVLCVVVVTHATMFSFIRSFTISLSTFWFVLLFYTLTHIWHLPKQNIRTQIHAHRRSQCIYTNNCQIYFTRKFAISTILNFLMEHQTIIMPFPCKFWNLWPYFRFLDLFSINQEMRRKDFK